MKKLTDSVVDKISMDFLRNQVLKNAGFYLRDGEIHALMGENGAGKTTLIRTICGLQAPTSGTYSLYGVKNTDKRIREAQQRIGAVVESPAVYLDMSAENNLKHQYHVLGLPTYDGLKELLHLVGLEKTGRKKVRNYSLGMKQRLGIAVALAGNPDFLILDEPTNGLDPQGIIELRELILKLNRQRQITVLISSHNLDELSRLATHYGFIVDGSMVKEITAEELAKACRKCAVLTVTDTGVLARALDLLGLEYDILSESTANVYGEIPISELTLELAKDQCRILSLHEKDETLESYYINLTGGGRYE